MLEINQLRENKDEIIDLLNRKNFQARNLIDKIILIDNKRKTNQHQLDNILAQLNQISKEIGNLYKEGKHNEVEILKSKTVLLKEDSNKAQAKQNAIFHEIQNLLYQIPNIPSKEVPIGKSKNDNIEVYKSPFTVHLNNSAIPHWELAKKHDLIDFDLGVKITGAGFPVYRNKGAKLQRALINYFLDKAIENGYEEVQAPLLINEQSGISTGQLPDKEGQMYHITGDHLFLIPTAEVPITNIFRNVILKEDELPKKICGYTPCFRREAGSYGKDVRGLNRLHQFDKVEIVQITKPENSKETLQNMINYVKSILEELQMPFRILKLCGNDLGFASSITYDFEVYSMAQKRWLEVSSVSNFKSFQSNRMKCRYKTKNGNQLVHTLNGSALALPRIVAALLENNQMKNGIKIPSALVAYTQFEII